MSGHFVIELDVPAAPELLWSRLWDLDRHTAAIPLTTVTADPPTQSLAEGVRFTGRTALGPFGFDDAMVVTRWQQPRLASIDKVGRLLGGRIEVRVTATATGSRVSWQQRIDVPWLPSGVRFFEGWIARLAQPGYRHALNEIVRAP